MITILGRTTFRNEHKLFGIKREDRRHHIYIIGQTGTGKSTLLESMALQDMAAGEGLAVLDPHGDLVERLVECVPESRRDDLIYFNVPDPTQPWGFNPLANVLPEKRPLAASALLDAFKKLWIDSWGPRSEHILRNALLALIEQPSATLADVLRLISEDDYRREAMTRVSNIQVRRFWLKEYAGYTARFRVEAIAPIQNKVGAFLAHPLLYAILTQPKQSLDMRRVMDTGKVLLVNLSKGKIGEDIAALLGSLLVASIGTAALNRADVAPDERRDFWVYLDEFHSMATLSLANMLSELRKYGVGFTLAHQHLAQISDTIQAAVLGNVGAICCFRAGPLDADIVAPHLWPALHPSDVSSMPNHQIYVRLLIDGRPWEAFSAETLRVDQLSTR